MPGNTSKEDLRRLMVERRARLDQACRERASAAAASRLLETLGGLTVRCVAGFWPLEGEIDPRPAVAALARRGAGQALPRMQSFREPLAFHLHIPGVPLVEGRFKVMEPPADAPPAEPDLILVPLLAFDRRGHRLGYGAGFYDRTIAEHRRRRPIRAIGFAFACQEADEVPLEPHDQPLDGVVT
ncbi:MAG: 5-formyltetrahydrofolate cyclo-ligase, partial [Geminicoccaceae bacterium]|nr:5-formyltetrahydrofolate cyclo-ligase [Geminicoccaceae bacterium]